MFFNSLSLYNARLLSEAPASQAKMPARSLEYVSDNIVEKFRLLSEIPALLAATPESSRRDFQKLENAGIAHFFTATGVAELKARIERLEIASATASGIPVMSQMSTNIIGLDQFSGAGSSQLGEHYRVALQEIRDNLDSLREIRGGYIGLTKSGREFVEENKLK